MCPSWNRVADEIEALASDRLLAAQREPDPGERGLLAREAHLLHLAADAALTRPTDAWLVHSACEGVVLHCDRFVMWGISTQAEDALRAIACDALARDALEEADAPDALEVLRVVLGVPLQPTGAGDAGGPHVPGPGCAPALL